MPPQNYARSYIVSSQIHKKAPNAADCRELCLRVARKLKFSASDPQRWYSVTLDDFLDLGGLEILDHYQDDVYQLLTDAFPSLPLEPWRFVGGPLRCLGDPKQRKMFLDWMAEQLSVQEPSQWKNKLTKTNLSKLGVQVSPAAVRRALCQDQPQTDWASIFRTTADLDPPKRFIGSSDVTWDAVSARQQLHGLLVANSLQHLGLAGWYCVTNEMLAREPLTCDILRSIGDGFLSSTLEILYPEHSWELWRLGALPAGFWDSQKNLRRFLNSVVPHDSALPSWYSVPASALSGVPGGHSLLSHYNNQLYLALKAAYPDHKWKPWKFSVTPSSIWHSLSMQRSFLDDVASEIGISDKSQWYYISSRQLRDYGGKTLLDNFYQGSAALCISSVYSEHPWEIWRFIYPGFKWWIIPAHAKQYLENISTRLQVRSPEDWYFVKLGKGSSIESHIRQQGFDLPSCLATAYPDHTWQSWRFGSVRSSWSPESKKRTIEPTAQVQGLDTEHLKAAGKPQRPLQSQDSLRELYKKVFASKDT